MFLMRQLWRRNASASSSSSSLTSSSYTHCYYDDNTNYLLYKLLKCNQQPICRFQLKSLCTKTSSSSSSSGVSKYEQQMKQLDNLNFMTATKMLFDEPSKKKKFGLDFHLVQLFFACLPSLAVYLVAQYARSEMRKMDAQLEKKKKEEETKENEIEQIAAAEKMAEKDQLVEVKNRIEKLEEVVKEIAVVSKIQSNPIINDKKKLSTSQSGDIQSSSGTTTSIVKKQVSESKSDELKPSLNQEKKNESS